MLVYTKKKKKTTFFFIFWSLYYIRTLYLYSIKYSFNYWNLSSLAKTPLSCFYEKSNVYGYCLYSVIYKLRIFHAIFKNNPLFTPLEFRIQKVVNSVRICGLFYSWFTKVFKIRFKYFASFKSFMEKFIGMTPRDFTLLKRQWFSSILRSQSRKVPITIYTRKGLFRQMAFWCKTYKLSKMTRSPQLLAQLKKEKIRFIN